MKLQNSNAVLFVPDGANEEIALQRTTHLALAAHQDDIELMAYKGIVECFGLKDKWFTGVVVTDGAGSSRSGLYENYTDEDMKNIRIIEQKKAAFVGEYSAQLLLGYTSKQVKDSNNKDVIKEFEKIILETNPKIIYTHNLADKHDTHCGVAVKVIKALRNIPKEKRPEKVYGCEVWRDLDWVCDEEKVFFDTSEHPNIAMSLTSVFDSQIVGGKRYDLAAEGRRVANATYSASHSVDSVTALNYGIDLTPLIEDEKLDIIEYITGYIDRFKQDVKDRLIKVTK
jgi:LmbE family N-acetylglucosaminyl deacetylase